jgi:glutathione S-transferase
MYVQFFSDRQCRLDWAVSKLSRQLWRTDEEKTVNPGKDDQQQLQLWGGATSRTFRAHWMLHELDLPYTPHLIGSRTGETQTPEFRSLNPKGKIPVLVDGELVLSESVAIVTYLGDHYDTHPLEERLVPAPLSRSRAHYDEWMSFIQMELDAHTLYIIRRHRDLAALYGEAPTAIKAAEEGFSSQLLAATRLLENQPYLLGEHFSAADLVLTSCLDWARVYQIALPAHLQHYHSRIRQRPAYRSAAALNFSISPGG